MDNGGDILRLCRLCLVKDDVNIPIFEEQGDIRQIFLKISSCLPVKVSREDKLPKKICDGCSYKLDMLYEFWNTTANAEKQLLSWLGEAGMNAKMADGTISAVAQQIKPVETFVKQEAIDPSDIHTEDDDKSYMFQQKFAVEEAGPSATVTSNEEEPPPKRARRTAAVKAQIAMDPESDDDDDSGEPMTKVEDESEESDGDDHEPPFVDVPSTSADDQPGPSGVGKDGVEAPTSDENEVLEKLNIMCEGCKKKFMTPDELEHHLANIQVEITYFCPPCNDFFNKDHPCNLSGKRCVHCKHLIDPKNPRYHACFHEPVGKKFYSPFEESAGLGQEDILQLKNLWKQKLATDKHEILKQKLATDKRKMYKCKVCDKIFDSIDKLAYHREAIVPRMIFFCRACENFFNECRNHGSCRSSFLVGHCYYCKQKLQRSQHKSHVCFHKDNVGEATSYLDDKDFIYFCERCKKYLPIELVAIHDRRLHREERNKLNCSECDIEFKSRLEFKKHKRLLHNIFLCHICGQNVPNHKITSHLDGHSNRKNFKCPKCDKRFNKKDRLARHRLVHSDEAKWKCASCGKAFKVKYNLRVHMRTHTHIKPFECLICKKTFTTKQSRDSHLKTHNVLNRS